MLKQKVFNLVCFALLNVFLVTNCSSFGKLTHFKSSEDSRDIASRNPASWNPWAKLSIPLWTRRRDYDRDKGTFKPAAKGVILGSKLSLDSLPAGVLARQENLILDKMYGGVVFEDSVISHQRMILKKVWIYRWKRLRNAAAVEKLCKKLSALPFLDYCEPDFVLQAN